MIIVRSKLLCAVAVLAALSATIFGVGAAFGKRDVGRVGALARVHRTAAPHIVHRSARARVRVRGHMARRHRQRANRALRLHRGRARALRHAARVRARKARRLRHARMLAAKRRRLHARAQRQARIRARRRHRHHQRARHHAHRKVKVQAHLAHTADVASAGAASSLVTVVSRQPGAQASSVAQLPSTAPVPASIARVRTRPAAGTASSSRALGARPYDGAAPATAAPRSTLSRAAAHLHVKHTSASGHRSRSAASTPSAPAAPTFLTAPPSVIQHFVRVVPEAIWIVLGVALAIAGTAGSVALRTTRRARRQAGEFAAVAAVAHTDSLTDALNRRGFGEAVERELARARRYHSPFVLAYFDVRGLKRLNDTEGHRAGDVLLKEVAALLKDSAREADVVGRIGGDEFALLLTEQGDDSADAVTSRIRRRVAERRAALALGVHWDLTIGTAAYPADGESFDDLLAVADRRLYEQRGIELVGSGRSA